MAKQRFFVLCPRTKNKLSVSRDVYNLVVKGENNVLKQQHVQEKVSEALKIVSEEYENRFYEGDHNNVSAKFRFFKDGSLSTKDAGLQINCRDEIKAEVYSHCTDLIKVINNMLELRYTHLKIDSEKKAKELSRKCA